MATPQYQLSDPLWGLDALVENPCLKLTLIGLLSLIRVWTCFWFLPCSYHISFILHSIICLVMTLVALALCYMGLCLLFLIGPLLWASECTPEFDIDARFSDIIWICCYIQILFFLLVHPWGRSGHIYSIIPYDVFTQCILPYPHLFFKWYYLVYLRHAPHWPKDWMLWHQQVIQSAWAILSDINLIFNGNLSWVIYVLMCDIPISSCSFAVSYHVFSALRPAVLLSISWCHIATV